MKTKSPRHRKRPSNNTIKNKKRRNPFPALSHMDPSSPPFDPYLDPSTTHNVSSKPHLGLGFNPNRRRTKDHPHSSKRPNQYPKPPNHYLPPLNRSESNVQLEYHGKNVASTIPVFPNELVFTTHPDTLLEYHIRFVCGPILGSFEFKSSSTNEDRIDSKLPLGLVSSVDASQEECTESIDMADNRMDMVNQTTTVSLEPVVIPPITVDSHTSVSITMDLDSCTLSKLMDLDLDINRVDKNGLDSGGTLDDADRFYIDTSPSTDLLPLISPSQIMDLVCTSPKVQVLELDSELDQCIPEPPSSPVGVVFGSKQLPLPGTLQSETETSDTSSVCETFDLEGVDDEIHSSDDSLLEMIDRINNEYSTEDDASSTASESSPRIVFYSVPLLFEEIGRMSDCSSLSENQVGIMSDSSDSSLLENQVGMMSDSSDSQNTRNLMANPYLLQWAANSLDQGMAEMIEYPTTYPQRTRKPNTGGCKNPVPHETDTSTTPLDARELNARIIQFMNSPGKKKIEFPIECKQSRRLVKELAGHYCLKAKANGKWPNRSMQLIKIAKTPPLQHRDRQLIDKLLARYAAPNKKGPAETKHRNVAKVNTRMIGPGYEVGSSAEPIGETNVGHRMLRSLGWTPGCGIGCRNDGIQAPIPAVVRGRNRGLGS